MSNVGERERATQNRVVAFFQSELQYDYLGDWHNREGNRNIEPAPLLRYLFPVDAS
jgi:type I restriction enzyme R subunit